MYRVTFTAWHDVPSEKFRHIGKSGECAFHFSFEIKYRPTQFFFPHKKGGNDISMIACDIKFLLICPSADFDGSTYIIISICHHSFIYLDVNQERERERYESFRPN